MTQPCILVVDDEPAMLRAVERVLGGKYDVRTAHNLAAALEHAGTDSVDVAIVDVRMPEDDGFAVSAKLRELEPSIDVIFMTGAIHELDTQLVRSIRERAFYFIQKPFERDVLLTIVERCIELRRLEAQNRRHVDRLEEELRQARSFQRSMLPPTDACMQGVALHARYLPCDELGGDLYDFVSAGDGAVTVLVADVSGHGVSAAMLTAIVKSALHAAGDSGFAPLDVVSRIAEGLCSFDAGRFVTAFVGRLSTSDGSLEFVNAGHPSGLLWGPERELDELGPSGPMISPAFPGIAREMRRVPFGLDDRLLVYTDGLVEARGEQGVFGRERLAALAAGAPEAGTTILDGILDAVARFGGGRPADDDRTLLLAGFE